MNCLLCTCLALLSLHNWFVYVATTHEFILESLEDLRYGGEGGGGNDRQELKLREHHCVILQRASLGLQGSRERRGAVIREKVTRSRKRKGSCTYSGTS